MKNLLFNTVSVMVLCITAIACETLHTGTISEDSEYEYTLNFLSGEICSVRSMTPDEDRISDINLFIFNGQKALEKHLYITENQLIQTGNLHSYRLKLLKNCKYYIYAFANAGYSVNIDNYDDLMKKKYYFTYPDDFSIGLPMTGMTETTISDKGNIDILLKRMVSKISVRIDRSRINDDISFNVKSIQIGGCPRSAFLFCDSKAVCEGDVFVVGYRKDETDANLLNMEESQHKSFPVSLYMFENMQGDQLHGAISHKDKHFPKGDLRSKICSYIEIVIDYISPTMVSNPKKGLIYRFYLGDNPVNFDVRRNTHYKVTVIPEGNGLNGDDWHIDKEFLNPQET